MPPIKTGLIGCGKVAHIHAAALKRMPESHFTAVCSANPERARAFGEQYGVKAYDDVEKFVREAGVEAVCICTPHPQHADPSIACVGRGIHVLIEKPLASTLEDCDRIIGAARKGRAKVGIVSQRRFYAPSLRIRAAIDAGKIGRPVLGSVAMYGWRDEKYYRSDPWRGSWKGEGGGVLVNQAPHQLDLLLWYMGPIAELSGMWGNFNHPYIEVEDTAVAVIRFQNGGLGQILVSNAVKPALYGRVQINGSNGATVGVQTDGGTMFLPGVSKISEPPMTDVWTVQGEEHLKAQWLKEDTELFSGMDPIAHYHELQIRDFLRAVMEGREPLIGGEDGRRVVELFEGLYRSNREGVVVKFPVN